MSNVLINGLKAKTGGGRTILNNYLSLLRESNSTHRYYVLTPEKREYAKYGCDFVQIVEIRELFKNNVFFPLLYRVVMPRLLRSCNIDAIFNLGDIVIPANIPQVDLFYWSYAAYPNSVAWKRMDPTSYINHKIKLSVFKKNIKHATTVIAQIKTMKERLETLYGLRNIEVIPTAVPLENVVGGESFDYGLPKDRIKFLCLAHYYSHKNLEVCLPLARRIKEMSLSYCIVITIKPTQHSRAKKLLNCIRKERLNDIIVNVGAVPMDFVPCLYSQCDALLMPTLLESYSSTYLEAMFHHKTILTSNLDFAKDVCGQAAFYFDPLDPESILTSMNYAVEDKEQRMWRIEEGKKQLNRSLNWHQVFEKYQALLQLSLEKRA